MCLLCISSAQNHYVIFHFAHYLLLVLVFYFLFIYFIFFHIYFGMSPLTFIVDSKVVTYLLTKTIFPVVHMIINTLNPLKLYILYIYI